MSTPLETVMGQEFVINELLERAMNDVMTTNNWTGINREYSSGEDYFDTRRDIGKECGWPDYMSPEGYKRLYDRNSVANRVITLWSSECWISQPEVYENKDEELTEFEEAWNELPKQLSVGNSWFQPQKKEGNRIWSKLSKADEISGIGSFGVLFIGFNDGLNYDQPVPGIEEQNTSSQKSVDDKNEPIKDFQLIANSDSGIYKFSTNAEKQSGREITFLRPLPETQIQIQSYENNPTSPRYGKPTYYLLDLTDSSDIAHTAQGVPLGSVSVHWSRILHIADRRVSSDVFGTPKAQQNLNNLLNIRKVSGSANEGYWCNAFPILNFQTHPQLGADVTIDRDKLKKEVEAVYNKMKRYLATSGMEADSIKLDIKDPTPFINSEIDQICIKEGCPKRIFVGSERGELSSSQDAKSWNNRVMHRQESYLSPEVISEFIDILIRSGVLPEPAEGFKIEWPDLNNMSENEVVEIGAKRTEAIAKYVSAGANQLIEPFHFMTQILGIDEETAKSIIEESEGSEDGDNDE